MNSKSILHNGLINVVVFRNIKFVLVGRLHQFCTSTVWNGILVFWFISVAFVIERITILFKILLM